MGDGREDVWFGFDDGLTDDGRIDSDDLRGCRGSGLCAGGASFLGGSGFVSSSKIVMRPLSCKLSGQADKTDNANDVNGLHETAGGTLADVAGHWQAQNGTQRRTQNGTLSRFALTCPGDISA